LVVPELRPRSVGEVLDAAVRVYRARFGMLMRVALLVIVPVSALSMLVLLSALPDDFTVGIGGDLTPVYGDDTDAAVQIAAVVVTTLLSALATAFVTAATTRIVAEAYVGHPSSAGDATRETGRRLLPIVGVTLLVTAGTAAGYLLCVVPGVLLAAAWSIAVPVLLLEGTGVFRALGRSVELTKVRFWLSFGVFWLTQVLVVALSAGLAAALGLAIRANDSPSADVIAQSVANAVASVITVPFAAAAVVALYFDLRIRAEAFDVQMMLLRLDEPPVPDSMPSGSIAAGRTTAREP
jgi:hypothetical protein